MGVPGPEQPPTTDALRLSLSSVVSSAFLGLGGDAGTFNLPDHLLFYFAWPVGPGLEGKNIPRRLFLCLLRPTVRGSGRAGRPTLQKRATGPSGWAECNPTLRCTALYGQSSSRRPRRLDDKQPQLHVSICVLAGASMRARADPAIRGGPRSLGGP